MKRRNLVDDEKAAVYVEFLVVFMPLFMLFLGMIQVGFLFTGKLVVRNAANVAARSAIVVIPDDPAHFDTEREQVNYNGTETPEIVSRLAAAFGVPLPAGLLSRGDARLNTIRLATFRPLMAIAPPPGAVFGGAAPDSVLGAIGMENGGAIAGRILAGFTYNATASAVTFPSGPGAGGVETAGQVTFPGHSRSGPTQLTARVTYAFHCLVPGAAKLMCSNWGGLPAQSPEGWNELNAAPVRGAAVIGGLSGGRYYILRADSEMTYQGALYNYQGE